MTKKQDFERSSQEFSGNAAYLEQLYETYTTETTSHNASWDRYFSEVSQGQDQGLSHHKIREQVAANVRQVCRQVPAQDAGHSSGLQMVDHFRRHGHLYANIDPLKLIPTRAEIPSLADFGLNPSSEVAADLAGSTTTTTAEALFDQCQKTYSGSIGIEFMHLEPGSMRDWLQQKFEQYATWTPSVAQVKQTLYQLQCAENMEAIMGRKFVGQTRFSLEGGDALIPLLESLLSQSAEKHGLKEAVIGMPHRGRLNVMLNTMGMRFDDIVDIYSGKREDIHTSSDVTYHMGYSSDRDFNGNPVHLSLAFNPSHLEFIAPVVMGSVKSRQQLFYSEQPSAVMPIILHGDSAIAGQGVVAEWFNMMHAPAHQIHGGIHIVVNNQIGFTTYRQASRSGVYCTDAHKFANVPVLHVNGDDIDAVLFCAELAAEFRAKFKQSIILDLNCYRKYGHNEGDDPNFTQPEMYQVIRSHPSPLKQYQQKCTDHYQIPATEIEANAAAIVKKLKAGDRTLSLIDAKPVLSSREQLWSDFKAEMSMKPEPTAVSHSELKLLGEQIVGHPEGFNIHRQVEKLYQEYRLAFTEQHLVRWGLAEQLAYSSLLAEGYGVRMVGQDVERGTFSHRHAVLHDQKSGEVHIPLQSQMPTPRQFQIYNSVLSEQAVLGFEFGFSGVDPNTLVIWEAQYGDFCNGAQVIIDQFISSAWQKWKRLSGLVMLLPHGYEGAGPEHSSARLERFLQLCAQQNMRVCMPSNAAQIFHLLRLQMKQKARVPLVVMTPKKSLRLPEAMSPLSDFYDGGFQTIIDETADLPVKKISRVLLCSGKIYYDLLAYRNEHQLHHVAIVRVEQLYPFDEQRCREILGQFTKLKEVAWCQEEPKNQGSWYSIRHHIEASIAANISLKCISRIRSASPAAGYAALHKQRQQQLIEAAFQNF